MFLGDSKTSTGNPWPVALVASLNTSWPQRYVGHNGGVPGETIDVGSNKATTNIGATLAAMPADGGNVNYRYVLLNWGANDMTALPAEATWETDYLAVIDAIHAKAPNAKVYVMRPWRRGKDADSAMLHGWIDTIVAARAFTYVGPDEAVWLKGADDGATNTVEGVHYTTAGDAACAAQWRTVLGF